eukprot:symbB.v1.2.008306.t1/scaffold499.1/size195312/12
MVQGRLRCSRAWDGGKGGPWPQLTSEKDWEATLRTSSASPCESANSTSSESEDMMDSDTERPDGLPPQPHPQKFGNGKCHVCVMSEQPDEEPGDSVEEVTRGIATLAVSTPGSALRPLVYFPGERHPRSPSASDPFSPELLGPIEPDLPDTPTGGETHLIGIWNETGQLCNVHWPDPDIHYIASVPIFPDTRYYVVWIVPNATDLTGDFHPPWRQALIVTEPKKRGRQILVVRAADKEIENKTDQLTFFSCEGMSFILVEGTAEKLRSQCPADISHRALEVDVKKLFAKASQVVEEESLQFATASEVEDLQQPRSRRGDSTSSESSRSAESGGSEADEVLKLLKRAGKSKPGKAILSGDIAEDKPKARSRYSLLSSAKEKKEGETLDVDALLLKNLASGSAGPSTLDLNALVHMQILKELRGKGGRKKSKNTITMDDSGSSEDETSSSDEKVRLRGAGKALKAYRQSHKAMKSRTLKHVRRYVKEVEEQLGASLHFGISEALETLLKGKVEQSALQLTLLLRAIHQCSLDGGNWKVAWLLTHMVDPLERPKFGGEAQDLEIIASYVRAMGDLEKRSKSHAETDEEAKEWRKKGKGKGKKTDEGAAE